MRRQTEKGINFDGNGALMPKEVDMFDFSVSLLPLVVLALVNFFLSWLWYSPLLFAKPWMKALGIDPQHKMTEEDKKKMPWLFINGIVASLLVVYGMMVIVHSLKATGFFSGFVVGILIWAGFALTHSLNTLWEGRKPVVLAINNGLFLFTYAMYGGILSVWR
jgi:hypothetical protein